MKTVHRNARKRKSRYRNKKKKPGNDSFASSSSTAKTQQQQLPTGVAKEIKNQPQPPKTSAHQTPQNSVAAAQNPTARKCKNKQYWNQQIKNQAVQNIAKDPPQKKSAYNPVQSPKVGTAQKIPVKFVASPAPQSHSQTGAIPKQLKTQNQVAAKKLPLSKPNVSQKKVQTSTTASPVKEYKTPDKKSTPVKTPKNPSNTKSSNKFQTGAIPRHVGESPIHLNPFNFSDIPDNKDLFTNSTASTQSNPPENKNRSSLGGSPLFHSLQKPVVQTASAVQFEQNFDNSKQNHFTFKAISASAATEPLSEPLLNFRTSERIAASFPFPSTSTLNLGYPYLQDTFSTLWLEQHSVAKSPVFNYPDEPDSDKESARSKTKSPSPAPKSITSFFKGVVGFFTKKDKKRNKQNDEENASKTTSKFAPSLFTDQRIAFKFNDISPQKLVSASALDGTSCGTCRLKFELESELMKHNATDEHLFLEFYHSCR